MREDPSRIRMIDTLDLFEEMCVLEDAARKPMILLLNKIDLLRDKIERSAIKSFFPEYQGIDCLLFFSSPKVH